MTTVTCPEGHQSNDPDYCDTCGARIGGAAPGPPPVTSPTAAVAVTPATAAPPAGPTGPTVTCAHCGTLNAVDALFCESCGYDFTTGQAPPPPPAPVAAPPAAPGGDGPTDFAVEVAVDPAWYALQGAGSAEPCPPATAVTLAVRGTAVLIGRTSVERAIAPEVALDADPGVSRRHAQLVQDTAGAWSVVDLGSMNGTYLVAGGGVPAAVPTPLASGEPVALAPGDAVYVGAWSRVTLVDRRSPSPDPVPDPAASADPAAPDPSPTPEP